jgi:hypothetical protein
MSSIPIAEHVLRRIAAHCAHVDERHSFGIRPEPVVAIVRRHGGKPAGRRGAGGCGGRRSWWDRAQYFRK